MSTKNTEMELQEKWFYLGVTPRLDLGFRVPLGQNSFYCVKTPKYEAEILKGKRKANLYFTNVLQCFWYKGRQLWWVSDTTHETNAVT